MIYDEKKLLPATLTRVYLSKDSRLHNGIVQFLRRSGGYCNIYLKSQTEPRACLLLHIIFRLHICTFSPSPVLLQPMNLFPGINNVSSYLLTLNL